MFCANLGAALTIPVVGGYWWSLLTGAGSDSARSVALGTSGDSFISGSTTSSGAGLADAYLAKYGAGGNVIWQKTLGGAAAEIFNQIAVAASGNIYACGSTASQGAGGLDCLIVKYDSTGTVVWQRSLGTTGDQEFSSVALDNSENVYAVGTNLAANTGIIAKYNSAGTIQWQRTLTLAGGMSLNSVTVVAATGTLYTCGAPAGGGPYLLFSYDTSGTLQWQQTYSPAAGGGNSNGLSLDSGGSIYMTGLATGTVIDYRITLFKLTSAGAITWQRYLDTGSTSTEQGISTFVSNSGAVYVAGYTATGGTGSDSWLFAKYDTSGAIQWQRRLGTTASDVAWDIVVDANETMWLTGPSGTDMLSTKLPGDGSLTGTYGAVTYAVSTVPTGTDTFTASTATASSSTATLTDAARTLTAGTPTLTNTLTPIP